jgi:hypothetical protein
MVSIVPFQDGPSVFRVESESRSLRGQRSTLQQRGTERLLRFARNDECRQRDLIWTSPGIDQGKYPGDDLIMPVQTGV